MRDHPLLDTVARLGIRLGLDRMRRFLSSIGSPHLAAPVVHVGGTNGKGSVTTMISACLTAQGFKVGTCTSPHIQHFNERIRVDGEPISDEALGRLLDEMTERREQLRECLAADQGGEPFTYFELATALAFLYFARSEVDISVIEVGMGGRLDATNVVLPEVSVITSVALDHTEVLGTDIASIAGEKAGIFKPRRPVVLGLLPQEALRVLRVVAADRECPLMLAGEDFEIARETPPLTWQGPGGPVEDLRVGMAGDHQIDNAAVALAALACLPERLRCSHDALREGIARARISGRLEWVSASSTRLASAPSLEASPGALKARILLDGAHNPESAASLARYLASRQPEAPRVLLLGASLEKDVRTVAATLAPRVSRIVTTAAPHPRAMRPEELAHALGTLCVPIEVGGPIEEVLPRICREKADIIVTGSLFLVGAARDVLGLT